MPTLLRIIRNFALPLVPRETDLLDASRGIVVILLTATAANQRHFFLERRQPIGQIQSGPGRLKHQASDFLF